MKSYLPLLSLTLLVASCTTAYKTGQTPDDVYFSPERPQEEYVRMEKNEDRQYRPSERTREEDYYSYDDRYLRMKVRNRQRWDYLDNDFYSYNPYAYRYYNNYYSYNSPWNNYSYWNYYYNPYAPNIIVLNPKSPAVSRPRTFNLRTFDPQPNASNNPKMSNSRSTGYDGPLNNSKPRRNVGNDLRTIFGNSNSSSNRNSFPSNNSSNSSSRSSNSSSSSSNSSSGSSGSAPARRF